MDEFINASGLRRRTQLQPTGQSELELMAPDSYLVLRSPDTYLVHRSPDTYLVQFIHTLHTPYTQITCSNKYYYIYFKYNLDIWHTILSAHRAFHKFLKPKSVFTL